MIYNYDGRRFRPAVNSETGEVNEQTVFTYHEADGVVWAEYSGGSIRRGTLMASKSVSGELDMRYVHVNKDARLMTGVCRTTPELLPDGRYRLHERWQWTCGDGQSGESVLEELPEESG